MRVLVTGGAGYIGSVIADQLIDSGHHVTVLDDLSKGHDDAVSAKATFARGSLEDPAFLRHVFDAEQPDAVVHMAASSLVGESMIKPAAYYRNNVVAGFALLDAMHDAGVRKIVFSSTAAVYGEPTRQPVRETDAMAPTNPYGETKLAMERALYWHHRAYGLRAVSLRYFNAAGATALRGERHDPETHLIPLVLAAAAGEGSPITIFGDDYPTRDGTCVRDYVHVSDLARAHVAALEALDRHEIEYDAFNVGTGTGYTVLEVIDAAARVTGRPVPTVVGARRHGDPAVLVAAADRIREVMSWSAKEQSIVRIVESAWRWTRKQRTQTDVTPTASPA